MPAFVGSRWSEAPGHGQIVCVSATPGEGGLLATRNEWRTADGVKILDENRDIRLLAVGDDHYGVFSGANRPDHANFPSGVTYQRNHNFTSKTLTNLAGASVPISIDPFFFKLTL